MELNRVVVTGIGVVSPVGNNLTDFWNNLINGYSGADHITLYDASKFKTRIACEVKNFDPGQFIDRKEVRKMDRFTQFGIVASDQALLDAGLNEDNLNPDRIGVVFGSGIGGVQTFQQEVADFGKGDGTPRFSPFLFQNDPRYCRRPNLHEA